MQDDKADMVFTDPPYGMNLDVSNSNNIGSKDGWTSKAKNYENVIGDGEDFDPILITTIFDNFNYSKEIFIWGADYFAELIPNRKDGSWIVWDKRASVEDMKLTFSEFELCWSKNKHLREVARITWSGLLGTEQEFDHKRTHPTQKPTLLSKWFIEKYSKIDEIIVDIYAGSGFSLIACENLSRKCRAIEISPNYCAVILDRMATAFPELTIERIL
jgi:DNA modification methylase